MNAHQRRKSMTRRHLDFPLGARVGISRYGHMFDGRIFKHHRGERYTCLVILDEPLREGACRDIPFTYLTLLEPSLRQRGERPWYKKPPWSGAR